MHPKGLIQYCGYAMLEIAEEGLHGSQPCVARTGLVATRLFDVFEKGEDHRYVDIFDLQQTRSLAQSSRSERHQQLEAIGIGIASANACASFPGKMFAQERGEVLGKLGHAVTPRCNVSPAVGICAISSGVDWRYQ